MNEKYKYYLEKFAEEADRAITLFPIGFHNYHEAYAVIKEEVDEMWDAIKDNMKAKFIEEECIQIASMCLRLLMDLGEK